MEKQDIITEVTETIKGYLDKGYILYPKAMKASQGQDFFFVAVKENVGIAISAWNTTSDVDGIFRDTYEVWYEVFDVKEFEKSGNIFWIQSETEWKLGTPVVDKFYKSAKGWVKVN
jgi:hypothetical protein|nr:MAG TPA: hypothetical protein [Caudoviricetes sp.]